MHGDARLCILGFGVAARSSACVGAWVWCVSVCECVCARATPQEGACAVPVCLIVVRRVRGGRPVACGVSAQAPMCCTRGPSAVPADGCGEAWCQVCAPLA
eukprot:813649-Prymnesium_polylepis.1